MDTKVITQGAEGRQAAADLDRMARAQLARLTSGLSPISIGLAFADWAAHLAISPGKQMSLAMDAMECAQATLNAAAEASVKAWWPAAPASADDPAVPVHDTDRRFRSPGWDQWPYNVFSDAYVASQRLWAEATSGVTGVSERNERIVSSSIRQWIDVLSPTNLPWLNPDVLAATKRESGANLMRGFKHWMDDAAVAARLKAPEVDESYEVGVDVATTPGKVVFRNELMELIQYTPTTAKVQAEPILIVPAWIMKYYILDLSPKNSMVKYLVDQGHTVFMISWKNPTAVDRDRGMEDYRRDGVMAAIDVVSQILPSRRIHGVGYCLGGTMLSIAAATMGREHDERLASITLFAAQTDFTEAGDLMLFINESEVSMLEAMMWQHGVLDGSQMAGAFQLLRANDLVWSRMIKQYLYGERDQPNDLMAWNADETRMPYRMHSEYLSRLFLRNDLARGHYEVDGRPIWLNDIRVPYFVVGTVADHVAPWKSVYKAHLSPNEITFVLTSGGHNAGIVSEPGHAGRKYQILTRAAGGDYVDPDTWKATAPTKEGSWWPAWNTWLTAQSSGERNPPKMGTGGAFAIAGDAPGTYILQR